MLIKYRFNSKNKILSNAFLTQSGLENGKVWSVVLNIPLDMPFDGFKQSSKECNYLGHISLSSELVALIY